MAKTITERVSYGKSQHTLRGSQNAVAILIAGVLSPKLLVPYSIVM